MKKLNIAFAGTPSFAIPTLEKLIESKHTVKLVITQPDKPAGRGKKITCSAVKERAIAYNIDLYQPIKLTTKETINLFQQLDIDLLIVVAYGQIIAKEILAFPPLKSWNIHASLLPRWRGAAPIQRSIEAGDKQTGVSIMLMQEKLDAGPVLLQKTIPIHTCDNAGVIQDKLSQLGATALLEILSQETFSLMQGQIQNEVEATYAKKLEKAEGLLNFSQPAYQLVHKINAFNPYPIAYTLFRNNRLRIWSAQKIDSVHSDTDGKVLRVSVDGIDVSTGNGVLRILELQRPGSKKITARDYFNSQGKDKIIPGDILAAS